MKTTHDRLVQKASASVAILVAVLLASCDASAISSPDRPALEHQEPTSAASEATLVGRVVSVTDGDTLTVLVDNQQVRVRLAEIDAPERGQPWASRSRDVLRAIVDGESIQIVETDRDRWGRLVGRVYLEGRDVNAEMVQRGAAWAFLRYQTDPRFSGYQADAREARVGLWSLPDNETIPPWEWRAGQRVAPARQSDRQLSSVPVGLMGQGLSAGSDPSSFECGERQYCREMRSCEEARFHLERCAVSTIDGDGDGEPCEALCRSATAGVANQE